MTKELCIRGLSVTAYHRLFEGSWVQAGESCWQLEYTCRSAACSTSSVAVPTAQKSTLEEVDAILGELHSTSFANKALLGEQADHVEAEVRRALVALEPRGRFIQHLRTGYRVSEPRSRSR